MVTQRLKPLLLCLALAAAAAVGAQPAPETEGPTYFIAADEIDWNYAPAGVNLCFGEAFSGARVAGVWWGEECSLWPPRRRRRSSAVSAGRPQPSTPPLLGAPAARPSCLITANVASGCDEGIKEVVGWGDPMLPPVPPNTCAVQATPRSGRSWVWAAPTPRRNTADTPTAASR